MSAEPWHPFEQNHIDMIWDSSRLDVREVEEIFFWNPSLWSQRRVWSAQLQHAFRYVGRFHNQSITTDLTRRGLVKFLPAFGSHERISNIISCIGLTTHLGLLSPQETLYVLLDDHLPYLANDTSDTKYQTWSEAVALADNWQRDEKVIGLIHGTFDPPHIGHFRCIQHLHQHCDHVIVGIDPDPITAQRKGLDRPRYDIRWRLWELLQSPYVSAGIVMPITRTSDKAFNEIYQALHIDAIAVCPDNRLRRVYENRVGQGRVVVDPGSRVYSSTELHAHTHGILGQESAQFIEFLTNRASQSRVLHDHYTIAS